MVSFIQILKTAVSYKATDIHILKDSPPTLRISGEIIPLKVPSLSGKDCQEIIYSFLTLNQKAFLEENKEMDFSFGIKDLCRCRVNVYFQKGTVAGSFRILADKIPEIKDLGLPSSVKDVIGLKNGLVLVTGPTGSGKTTTVASIIKSISDQKQIHIVTIEDPVEYFFPHSQSIFSQRDLQIDTKNLNSALRSLLRQDPDIAMVGELRDRETIEAALTLAETGHLVFGTLHTNSAVGTLQRILGVFSANDQEKIKTQLSMTLKGVFSQNLVPTVEKKVALACEFLKVNSSIAHMIRDGKFHQIYGSMQMGQDKTGMITMNQSLLDLFNQNKIHQETAYNFSTDKKELESLFRDKAKKVG